MDSKARQRRTRKSIWDNPYSVLAFASLCWSGNHVVGRAITGHIPPLTISTIRWLVPVFIIWFMARSGIETDWPSVRQHWGIVLWLGITGGTRSAHFNTSVFNTQRH
jgi:drug/metabolite transporter (DMT)-like permease